MIDAPSQGRVHNQVCMEKTKDLLEWNSRSRVLVTFQHRISPGDTASGIFNAIKSIMYRIIHKII